MLLNHVVSWPFSLVAAKARPVASSASIDATTRQVFNAYAAGRRIAPAFQRDEMRRERAGYEAAIAVITKSDWAADSVCRDYGISPERVHVVPGGANLDEQALSNLPKAPLPPQPSLLKPLRLGFLGKDWERKGGPFILALAEELQNIGILRLWLLTFSHSCMLILSRATRLH